MWHVTVGERGSSRGAGGQDEEATCPVMSGGNMSASVSGPRNPHSNNGTHPDKGLPISL